MMTTVQIERDVLIEAPVDVVWRTVTEPEQITQWFADRVEIDPAPGGRGVLIFDNQGGDSVHTTPIVVEALEPPTRFAFRWNHPEGQTAAPGNSVLVEFRLSAEGAERTRLRVVETGVEDLGLSGDEQARYAEDHNEGWAYHLGRLSKLELRG